MSTDALLSIPLARLIQVEFRSRWESNLCDQFSGSSLDLLYRPLMHQSPCIDPSVSVDKPLVSVSFGPLISVDPQIPVACSVLSIIAVRRDPQCNYSIQLSFFFLLGGEEKASFNKDVKLHPKKYKQKSSIFLG